MPKDDKKNLLMPSGIIDLINDRAYKEFYLTQVLMSNFMENGYKIPTPPLISLILIHGDIGLMEFPFLKGFSV